MSPEAGVEVMRAARDAGITFLDDARYDDETGTAPIPTGYSEVVFGEAGLDRLRTDIRGAEPVGAAHRADRSGAAREVAAAPARRPAPRASGTCTSGAASTDRPGSTRVGLGPRG